MKVFEILTAALSTSACVLGGTVPSRSNGLPSIPGADICAANSSNPPIPNVANFVYWLRDGDRKFNFRFAEYLSMYAASYHWKPDTIYLHTNANRAQLQRARSGGDTKWIKMMFDTIPNLKINYMDSPTHAANGVKLVDHYPTHKTDFMRAMSLIEFGGIYIDFDVYALRDIAPLRNAGFQAVVSREPLSGSVQAGTVMTAKGGTLAKMWLEEQHIVYDGGWVTHANHALSRLSNRLSREDCEVLILDTPSMVPALWTPEKLDELWGVHNETAGNLDNFKPGPGAVLPEFNEGLRDRWERPQDFEPWERDWSESYMIHAFSQKHHAPDHQVPGFNDPESMTPYYVLNRQSNFARALYPVVRDMYHKGLVSLNDTWNGE